MPDYRRYRVPGVTCFFTVNYWNGGWTLGATYRSLARGGADGAATAAVPYRCWVVLPDHLHCLWALPEGDADFSMRWRLIKTAFAKALPVTQRRSAVRVERHERAIWQRRFWENAIRDERDYARHVDYIHYNPVKHGYVSRVAEWPHSTFHRFVMRGMYPPDWAGDMGLGLIAGERGEA